MCGIFFEVCFCGQSLLLDKNIKQRIENRGPNWMNTIEINLSSDTTITFGGSVLWMQGAHLSPQPLEDEAGVLLYNGDIFDETWSKEISDTQTIMDNLKHNVVENETHIIKTLKKLKGPFSLIYYDKINNNVYFARDRIGRSSMLFYKDKNRTVISSVLGRKYPCVEIPAVHLYSLNVGTQIIKLHSWMGNYSEEISLDTWLASLHRQQSMSDDEFKFTYHHDENDTDNNGVVEFIKTISETTEDKLAIMERLLKNKIIADTVHKVTHLLEKSIKIRLDRQPNMCKNCLQSGLSNCNHCTVGILFSGGLDCTVLARLTDKYLPIEQSIDLINVAFKKDVNTSFDVPDRLTGRQSYEELKKLCPSREWMFREVNIQKEELEDFQMSTIADLVYPRQTILDESLGSALWFAARGKADDSMSSCRVLLLGSGADELFGGYTRHRNAFKRHGWRGLEKELMLDWNRISFRNLSRDNRVICDHGRQPRMPYLDEEFTDYVLKLKPWLKCFPSEHLGPGIGDKLMLRLVAYNLGLSDAVILPKRALQFGSRIANKKEKGADVSKRFLDCNKVF